MTNFTDSNSLTTRGGHPQRSSVSASPLILIVEDHEDTRYMLRILLEMRGMCVVEAGDGETGLTVAAEIHPDLILMDLSLPTLDGLAIIRLVRAHETLLHVPIVVTSGHAFPKFKVEAFAAGCSDYLVKPIDFEELDCILLKYLSLNGASQNGRTGIVREFLSPGRSNRDGI